MEKTEINQDNDDFLKRKESRKKKPKVIGRKEIVDLPDLGLYHLHAKVDTGAWTSALHVSDIRRVVVKGVMYVKFRMEHPNHKHHSDAEHFFRLPIHGRKKVRSSNGQYEKRFIIKTRVMLFGKRYKSEFSLTDRSKMECPVLLGRKLLRDRFVVDVTQKNISFRKKKQKSESES